jgi:hypothetical protein
MWFREQMGGGSRGEERWEEGWRGEKDGDGEWEERAEKREGRQK